MYMFIRMALSLILCVSLGVIALVTVNQAGKGKKIDREQRTARGLVTEEKAPAVVAKATPKTPTPKPAEKKSEVTKVDFTNSPVVRKEPVVDNSVALAKFQNSPVVRKPVAPNPAKVEDRRETEEQMWARLKDSCYIQSLYTSVSREECRKVAHIGPPHVIAKIEKSVKARQNQTVAVPTDLVRFIKGHFPEAPIMVKVAKCESGIRHTHSNGSVVRGGKTPADVGLFQINTLAHGSELARLGLDVMKLEDNVRFARILYERNGLRDWAPSEHCWKGK